MDKKNKQTSIEITGALIGGGVGLIGGPVGTVVGSAVGIILSDVLARHLSRKEKTRIEKSVQYIDENIRKRLENGNLIRTDEFFTNINSQSSAEEVFEAILIKSKNEYQERKLKYISNIFSNFIFEKEIKLENINQILETTERLSYRKICLLKFCDENMKENFSSIRNSDYRNNYRFGTNIELELLLQDIMDLCTIGIIERKDDISLLDISDVYPKFMRLTNIGKVYFNILGAEDIPEKDYREVIDILCA